MTDVYVLDGAHLLRCVAGTAPGPGTFVPGDVYLALQAERDALKERVVELEEAEGALWDELKSLVGKR